MAFFFQRCAYAESRTANHQEGVILAAVPVREQFFLPRC